MVILERLLSNAVLWAWLSLSVDGGCSCGRLKARSAGAPEHGRSGLGEFEGKAAGASASLGLLVATMRPMLTRPGPLSADSGPVSACFCQFRPNFAPTLVNLLAESGRLWPTSDRVRCHFGRMFPLVGRIRPKLDRPRQNSGRFRP